MVDALRPALLDELGLPGALAAAADRIGPPPAVALQVTVDGPALPAGVEVAAYRIAVEAMTNAVQHAGAEHVNATVIRTATALLIQVDDDGAVLPPDHRVGGGLRTMRERAEELDGRFTVEPATGGGTRVVAEPPLTPEPVQ